jgi:hypothetical protein
MALTATLNIDFVDEKGKPSHTHINLPLGLTLVQYTEFGQALGDLFLTRSKCVITGMTVNIAIDIAGVVKDVALVASNVASKIKGLFTTASGKIAKFLIPGAMDSKTVAGSNDFDQTDTEIAALISAYEDGIGTTDHEVTFTNGRGSDVTAVSSMTQSFRRRKAV